MDEAIPKCYLLSGKVATMITMMTKVAGVVVMKRMVVTLMIEGGGKKERKKERKEEDNGQDLFPYLNAAGLHMRTLYPYARYGLDALKSLTRKRTCP